MITINFIGAGKLGKTLAKLFSQQKSLTVQAICNQSLSSAKRAVDFIGQGQAVRELRQLPFADITFITVPDNQIKHVAECLDQGRLKPGSLLVHCSGVEPSSVMKLKNNADVLTASVHPMRSFVDPALSVSQFAGTYCALEGAPKALALLHDLFGLIAARSYEIKSEKKALYHASGVFSANYLIALSDISFECLLSAGVEQCHALPIVTSLMQGVLDNLKTKIKPIDALTGPLARGDSETLGKHLNALDGLDREIYQQLAMKLLDIGSLSDEKKQALLAILR